MGLLSEPDYDAQHMEDECREERIAQALEEAEEDDYLIVAQLAALEADSIALEAEAARLAFEVEELAAPEARYPGLVKAPRAGVKQVEIAK